MDLKEALANLEEKNIYDIVKKKLDSGASAKEILKECQHGMKIVGERYNREEYFVADLMYAGEIMRNVMNTLSPHMKGAEGIEKVGTVVIGTVKGDIHDLGKDVVNITLQGNGFEVVDLGVDVSAEKFVEAIRKNMTVKKKGLTGNRAGAEFAVTLCMRYRCADIDNPLFQR